MRSKRPVALPAPPAPLSAVGDGRVVCVHEVAGEALEAQLMLPAQHWVGLVQLREETQIRFIRPLKIGHIHIVTDCPLWQYAGFSGLAS